MEKTFQYIKEQFEIGNYGRVVRNSNILLESEYFKNKAEVFRLKANALSCQQLVEEALSTFNIGISRFPSDINLRLSFGLFLIEIGEFERAKSELQIVRSLDSKNLGALYNLVYIEEVFKNQNSVIEISNLILDIKPDDFSSLLSIGAAYEKLGEYEKSIYNINKALRCSELDDLEYSIAYNNLGYTYSKLGDFHNAKMNFEQALNYDHDPYTINNLGYVIAYLGDIEKGLQLVNQSVLLDDSNSYAFKNRAKINLMRDDKKNALKDLLKAKELDYEIDYDNEVNQLIEKISNE